jgi:hypothetical protein
MLTGLGSGELGVAVVVGGEMRPVLEIVWSGVLELVVELFGKLTRVSEMG